MNPIHRFQHFFSSDHHPFWSCSIQSVFHQMRLQVWEKRNVPFWAKMNNLLGNINIPSQLTIQSTIFWEPLEHSFIDEKIKLHLLEYLKNLCPWRLGPWQYFDHFIDSEWVSSFKWNVFSQKIDLHARRVLDIGSNNLYFSYQMLTHQPHFVLAIDPIDRYYWHYCLNQKLAFQENLLFEPISLEQMPLELKFDYIFCMGVLYHRRHPVQCLELIYQMLNSGGTLVLETIVVNQAGPWILTPQIYMKQKNNWFIFTPEAILHLLEKVGFKNIQILGTYPCDPAYQRSSVWSPGESLLDFLSKDQSQTIEGWPKPFRCFILAEKNPKKLMSF